jgi:predicted nucleic acid-binding protein
MTVVDASVVADAIRATQGTADAAIARAIPPLAVPELLDLEVTSAYRKLVAAGLLTPEEGRQLLDRLRALPIDRHRHAPLLPRIWELRSIMSVYDAAYVALAESLGAVLLTRDSMFATAPGLRCEVLLVD